MTMDARKQRVLQAIVALYGLEGEPVGSSVLANYFDMAAAFVGSSPTIPARPLSPWLARGYFWNNFI